MKFPLAAPAGKDSGAMNKAPAGAVNTGIPDEKTWKYGPAADIPATATRMWNPAMIKIRNGGQTFAVLINRETGQAVHVLRVGEDSESRRLVFKRSKGERVLVNVG